jgi:hypothetical protein
MRCSPRRPACRWRRRSAGAAGRGTGLTCPVLSVLTLELSAPSEQGINSTVLQIVDALSVAVVLALAGALFAALVDTWPIA